MAESSLSASDKGQKLAELVTQAPPGEVNDVITDIRAIVSDDEALVPHVKPSLRAYNLDQLIVVDHPAADDIPAHTSILSHANTVPGTSGDQERFVDHEGKRSFTVDHTLLKLEKYESYQLPEAEETLRTDLHKSLKAYAKNHFASGICSVACSQHPTLPSEPPVAAAEATSGSAKEPQLATEEPVTDVVSEQVGDGKAEPAPTPAVGPDAAKHEEVDEPGGLEKVDEEIKEANAEEEQSERVETVSDERKERDAMDEGDQNMVPAMEATDATPNKAEPSVEESTKEEEPTIDTVTETAAVPAAEPRKQERIDNPVYTLQIVGNKYKLNNFWTGRWRSTWVVDHGAGSVKGDIKVDVHYFEQGNVQLSTSHSASFPLPTEKVKGQSVASQIVTTISKLETTYHLELNDVYGDLGDKAFRALRRALPVTRQKMDWDKVTGYSLGSSLAKAQ